MTAVAESSPARALDGARPEATRVRSTRLVTAVLLGLGVLNALLFYLIRPDVNDLWAARARTSAVQHGVGLTYWFSWFGGGATPGNYSIITPWVSSYIGTELLCALSAAVIPPLVHRLVRDTHHPTAATAVSVVTVGLNLWSGRVPFLFSAAIALAAVITFRERKLWPTLAIMAVSVIAAPTSGAFVALILGGVFLSLPAYRRLAFWTCGVIGAGMIAVALIFGSPGPEPFQSTLRIEMICAVLLMMLARPVIWLRTSLWLTVIATIAISSVPNAMGSNLSRLVWFVLPVAVVALSPRVLWLVIALVIPPVVAGGNGTYIDLRNAVKPVSSNAYYAPLAQQLDLLPDMTDYRLEVVDHGAHAAYEALLDHATLARGWETQEDIAYNTAVLDRNLSPTTYKVWLDNNAVGYVALPASTVNTYGEYNLVSKFAPPTYLQLIWQNPDWKLYKVRDARPIVAAPAQVVTTTQSRMVVDVPCACTIGVRVHWSKYLQGTGPTGLPAQVADDGNGWTQLTTTMPGTYQLKGTLG